MKYLTALSILLTMVGCKDAPKDKTVEVEQQGNTEDISSRFSIEVLDDEALQIIDPKSEIEVLASGFEWTEGPLWIAEGNYLLFSDIPNNKVYKLDAKNDTLTYLHPSGFSGENFTGKEPGSNGLLLNQKGELVLMQHGNRGVAKMNATLDAPRADYTVLVGNYEGKRFNSPNDGAFDKAGNLYFTDPPYGLPEGMDDPGKELDFQGVLLPFGHWGTSAGGHFDPPERNRALPGQPNPICCGIRSGTCRLVRLWTGRGWKDQKQETFFRYHPSDR